MPWQVAVPVLVVAAIALCAGLRWLPPNRHDERRR